MDFHHILDISDTERDDSNVTEGRILVRTLASHPPSPSPLNPVSLCFSQPTIPFSAASQMTPGDMNVAMEVIQAVS